MFLKKIVLILMAVVIAFSSVYIIPQKKVEAFNPAVGVPGGIYLGAGAYTVGAYALAGLVGLAGYTEYEEEINAHAGRAWENGSQLAKDSMQVMVDGSIGAGNAVMNVGEDMLNWLEKTYYPDIATKLSELPPYQFNGGTSVLNGTGTDVHGNIIEVQINHTFSGNNHIMVGSRKTQGIRVIAQFSETSRSYIAAYSSSTTPLVDKTVEIPYARAAVNLLKSNNYKPTSAQLAAVFALAGADVSLVGTSDTPIREFSQYKEGVSKIREQWESMRDAGLVLPVDGVTGYVGNNVVRYDGQSDTYRDDAGLVYTPGDITWSFPKPRVRTGEEVAVPGVYVDTPALTGNPAIDETITGNPAIPKTITNVNTGVTIANPDYATDVPIETPAPGVPGGGEWNRPPTKKPPNIGALVVTKFPFSLPWDLFGMIGWLQAEPKAPVFKLDTSMNNPFGEDMRFKTNFTLEFLDDYIGFFRSFILIGFSLFLILSTRKLLGGGS